MSSTHTYAFLDVTPMAFTEIKARLLKAGDDRGVVDDAIDMHGIAIRPIGKKPDGAVDIELGSLLSHRTGNGMVELSVNGERIQMDLDKAREVLAMLSSAIEAAITDQIVFAFLKKQLDFRDDQAAAALMDLREMRQGTRDVVRPS